jgi:hypothetical protein
MYSNLLSSDTSAFLDHLLTTQTAEVDDPKSPFWAHWRGRYGASTEEQERFWASVDPAPPGPSAQEVTPPARRVTLRFKTWEGEEKSVDASVGETLLQVARRADLPSMEGSCGGNLGKPSYLSAMFRL